MTNHNHQVTLSIRDVTSITYVIRPNDKMIIVRFSSDLECEEYDFHDLNRASKLRLLDLKYAIFSHFFVIILNTDGIS